MYLACKCQPEVPYEPLLNQLEKQNIEFQLIEQNGKQEVWVVDPRLVEPVAEYYRQYEDQLESRLSLRNLKATPITTGILLVTLIVAVFTQLGQVNTDAFFMAQVQYYPRSWMLYEGVENVWRFVSPMFLHFGIEHLIFNLLSFWYLGSKLERNLGGIMLSCLVVIVAVFSNLSQLVTSGPLFGGLSGVVYGFIGFSFLYQMSVKDLFIPKGLFYISLIWMGLGLTDILAVIGLGNMANAAHVSGLLMGFILFALHYVINMFNTKKGEVI